jgi:hypothetical protein
MQHEISISLTADNTQFIKKKDETVRLARDTKKELDKNKVFELEVKVGKLQSWLDNARARMKKAKKEWQKDVEFEARLEVNRLSRETTEAKRLLNNYLNTWEEWVSRLQAKFDQIKDKIGWSGWVTEVVGKLWQALWWLGIAVWLNSIIDKITTLWQKAAEAQAEESRLVTILGTTTWARKEQVQVLLDQAKALEKIWVVSAGNVVQTQSQLATFDLQIDTIKTLTPAILDYVTAEKWATATTEDFKSMTNWLAQALQGNFASLTKTWFVLDETTKNIISNGTEAERAAALVEVLNSTYKDFNKTLADTAEWRMQKLSIAFENLKVQIGEVFSPIILAVADQLTILTEKISDFARENETLTKVIVIGTTALWLLLWGITAIWLILPAITTWVTALWWAFALISWPIGIAIALLAWLYIAYQKNLWWIQDVVKWWVQNIKIAFETIRVIFERISTVIKPYLDRFKAVSSEAVKKVVDIFWWLNGIGDKVKKAMDIALTVMTLWLNKLVAFTFRKLSELDFIVSARQQAISNITNEKIQSSIKWNPNVARFDPKNIDFTKITPIKTQGLATIDEIPITSGWWGWWGGGRSKAKEIKEVTEEVKDYTKEIEASKKQIKGRLDSMETKKVDRLTKAGKEAFESINKEIDASTKKIEDFQKWIQGIDNELSKITDSLVSRTLKIEQELSKLRDDLVNEEDADRRAKILEEIRKLEEEYLLAKNNTDAEALETARLEAQKSETQKLLDKQALLEQEKEALQAKLEDELALQEKFQEKLQKLEETFTEKYQIELRKQEDARKQSLNNRLSAYRDMMAQMASMWWGGGVVDNSTSVTQNFTINNQSQASSIAFANKINPL